MTVHTFWQPDSFILSFWLEGEPSPAGGQAVPEAMHPADTGFAQLKRRLPAELDVFEEVHEVRLPTADGCPVRSDRPLPPEATLQRWSITCGESISDCAIDYLLAMPGNAERHNGLRWGASTRYWRRLVEFGLWLFDTKSYVPGIARLEGRYYPAWQAMYDRSATLRWQQLVGEMPPVCRAMNDAEATPAELTLTFLDAVVDCLVRRRLLLRHPQFGMPGRQRRPLHRQWLERLRTGRLKYLQGERDAITRFAAQVHTWNAPFRPHRGDLSWRLGFRLRAPAAAEGKWRVKLTVRSLKEPGLKFSAADIWQPDGPAQAFFPDLAETLFRDFGRARAVFPQLATAADEPCPSAVDLSRPEAQDFIVHIVGELALQGFAVELPNWLTDPGCRLGMRLVLSSGPQGSEQQAPKLGVKQLVAYQWRVALGDEELDDAEFRALAQSQEVLVHRRGRWLRVDSESVQRTVGFLDQKGGQGRATLSDAIQLGALLEKRHGLPVLDLRVEGRINDLFADLRPGQQARRLEPPDTLHGQLRPYQISGYSWLAFLRQMGFGACLADDMGLGKTVQMIALLLRRHAEGDATAPALIISPMSVVGNWAKEIERFGPALSVMIHHGADRDSPAEFAAAVTRHDVVITTYSLVVRDQATLLRTVWDCIILDEAQNIKNPATKQSIAVRSLRARDRFCLTGTPVENRLTELWSIMEFLNPGYLGRQGAFRTNFAVPIERDGDTQRAQLLRRMIRPFVLRRLKSDPSVIRDLPEKQEIKVYCNLTAEQAALYQQVVDTMLAQVDQAEGVSRRGLVLATLVKLKQITNHPVLSSRDEDGFTPNRSGKQQRLEEMLDVVLSEGDKSLIFTQFAEYGHLLCARLQERFGVEVLFMHGGTQQAKRDEMARRFQRDGGPPLFLLTLRTGGVGLNLTAASHVFHVDRWWNPAVENQATDRAYRIGQTRNVQVHKFLCVGTVEERVDQMIEEKKLLADHIVGSGESRITELSTDQLREIFTLSRDAVAE